MKKFLKLMFLPILVTTQTISVVGCNNSDNNITPLPGTDHDIAKNIINLNSIDNKLVAKETSRYHDFNDDVLNSIEITSLKPKLNGKVKIQYFVDDDLKIDLTDQLVNLKRVKIIITIISDSYYHGITKALTLNFVIGKVQLSHRLTSLDSLSGKITVAPERNYFELKTQIANAQEFQALYSPANNFNMEFYDQPNGKQINNDYQKFGTVYVVITALNTPDNIYQGATKPLAIALNKIALKQQITELDGLANTAMDFNKKFSDFDNLIMASQQIHNLKAKLAHGYQIRYYNQRNGQEITNKSQDRTHFYVVITAAADDLIYQGTTDFIAVATNKMDLSQYLQELEIAGRNLPVDPSQQFKALDNTIRNDLYITHMRMPLKADFTIHYYQDAEMKLEITNNYQTAETFYIAIKPANDDSLYQGSTKTFQVTFTKVQLVNMIKDLDSLKNQKIICDSTKNWKDLDTIVKAASQFKTIKKTLKLGYTIKYYDSFLDEITNQKQNLEPFFVVIRAVWNDPNYEGATDFMQFKLGKNELGK